jgi:hypothetical protein
MALTFAQLDTYLSGVFGSTGLVQTRVVQTGVWLNQLRTNYSSAYASEISSLGLTTNSAADYIAKSQADGNP